MGIFGNYCYEYPRPAFTVDVVVFSFIENQLKVLLIERGRDPFKGFWAFPGGFVDENELIVNAAERELHEETGLKLHKMEVFYVASEPGRDPRGWVVSAFFLGFVNHENAFIHPGDDAIKAQFCPLNNIPSLAFDHKKLLDEALKKLKSEIRKGIINPDILPENFELSAIRSLYSQIIGSDVETINLTERLKKFKIILPSGNDKKYCFDYKRYEEIQEFGFLQ